MLLFSKKKTSVFHISNVNPKNNDSHNVIPRSPVIHNCLPYNTWLVCGNRSVEKLKTGSLKQRSDNNINNMFTIFQKTYLPPPQSELTRY